MLSIRKNIVLDENHNPIAVQIPIKDFNLLKEAVENYGLAKSMDETITDGRLSIEEAKEVYLSHQNSKKLSEEFFSYAGLWEGRDISAFSIRKQAWPRQY
jgi:hypothetical protein